MCLEKESPRSALCAIVVDPAPRRLGIPRSRPRQAPQHSLHRPVNPKGYTRDPHIHSRFESEYVDLISTSEADVLPYVPQKARYFDDPWEANLKHSLDSRNFVEDVYRIDLRGGYKNKDDKEARELVYKRIAAGAAFLRDLAYTAWIDSAKPVPPVKPGEEPQNPANPLYNPAAGSAPAPEHSR